LIYIERFCDKNLEEIELDLRPLKAFKKLHIFENLTILLQILMHCINLHSRYPYTL